MELFCMVTAMLALLGPMVVGRVRCIRITPRLSAILIDLLPDWPTLPFPGPA